MTDSETEFMGGLSKPPKPPALARAPGDPERGSTPDSFTGSEFMGGLSRPPKPPALGEPGGLRGRTRQSRGAPRPPDSFTGSGSAGARNPPALIAAGLVALVIAVYGQVAGFAFLDWDDTRYVVDNADVRHGLTARGLAWAFTALHASNWHPLTWLAHMVDVEAFGLDAGAHHLVNVAWHAANAVLLFLLLRAATASVWRSAFAAALFAVHPLNVESIAWIAERKNVLSTFFGLLAMSAYVRHARAPSAARYFCVVLAFAASLLAKPMLVTLPIVLLLWDVWPLRRIVPSSLRRSSVRPVLEKLPLLALSVLSSAMTLVAQKAGGALAVTDAIPFSARAGNAVGSYAAYLGKALWPTSLAAFYPHPALGGGGIPDGRVTWAAVVLGAITLAVVLQWRRRPFLATGWLWYLVTLLPVIGLVQVGKQGMADRYAYVPLIGIFIAVAWAVPTLPPHARLRRWALAGVAAVLLVALGARASDQAAVWKDTATLFAHATVVTPDNWLAWKNVGVEHYRRERFDLAVAAFERSVRAYANDPETWTNLAASYAMTDQHAAAANALRAVLRLRPDDPDALANLFVAATLSRQPRLAMEALSRLLRLDPARARSLMTTIREAR